MKVGDYVRTKSGTISKIKKLFEKEDYIFLDVNNNVSGKQNIIKSSPNIIDLIEVGDVISYKDGSIARILEIPYTNPNHHKYYLIADISGEQYYERDEWFVDNIKSIVTKEQFSSMEYKVESD